MKWKTATISAFLISSLAACAIEGDFCVVYQPVPEIDLGTATQMVQNSRPSAVSIAANQTYYARNCR